MISTEGQELGHRYTMSAWGGSCLCRTCDPPSDLCEYDEPEGEDENL